MTKPLTKEERQRLLASRDQGGDLDPGIAGIETWWDVVDGYEATVQELEEKNIALDQLFGVQPELAAALDRIQELLGVKDQAQRVIAYGRHMGPDLYCPSCGHDPCEFNALLTALQEEDRNAERRTLGAKPSV